MNTNGGTLSVGVADDGEALGLDANNFPNEDKMALHLVNLIRGRIGAGCLTEVHPRFEDHGEHRVLIIDCTPASTPDVCSRWEGGEALLQLLIQRYLGAGARRPAHPDYIARSA